MPKYLTMLEENINEELGLKRIDEIRNYLIDKINQNNLMSKKQKKVCGVLNNIYHSLNVISIITECVSISAFASLLGICIGIAILQ